MKFGQNFHLFQVPEWEVFYVNYNLLKQLVKKAVKSASPPNFTGLLEQQLLLNEFSKLYSETYACLNSNIETLKSFRKDKYDFWRRSETELCNSYGISISISIIPALNEVDEYELKQLLEAFGEIRKGLMRLQWYDRVNQDAVHRIYAKIDRCCKSVGRSHAGHESRRMESQFAWGITCLEEVERLDRWVANIDRARSQSGPPRRSLYLKNLCNERSPALIEPDDIFHPIRNDQPSTLAILLH
jgi:glycerophosphodiester phosphodiesterase